MPLAAKMGEWEMRCKFRLARLLGRFKRGQVKSILLAEWRAPKTAGQIAGTKSRTESWIDPAGIELARVHYYKLPSGSIGASGLPDPIALLYEGVLYFKEKDPPPAAIFQFGGSLFWLMRIFRRARCYLIHK